MICSITLRVALKIKGSSRVCWKLLLLLFPRPVVEKEIHVLLSPGLVQFFKKIITAFVRSIKD